MEYYSAIKNSTFESFLMRWMKLEPIIQSEVSKKEKHQYSILTHIVRAGHGTTDWFQIGKGVRQGCILSPCLFNLYPEYIMRNTGLEETQAGIKIAGRNINNLRYADNTTLMAESEEELKSLLKKVKEESEKVGLKLNIQKTKTMASGPITSWEKDGQTVETVSDFIFGAPKSSCPLPLPQSPKDCSIHLCLFFSLLFHFLQEAF